MFYSQISGATGGGRGRWRGLALAAALALAAFVAGCADDPVKAQPEFGGTIFQPDTAAAASDTASDTGSTAIADLNVGGKDTAAVCPGGAGCICAANPECDSGKCIPTPAGKRCAKICDDNECPAGFACKNWGGGSGDVVNVCVPTWGNLCDPCSSSAACVAPGQPSGKCVAHGEAGSFCGAACTAEADCPSGFDCKSLPSVDGPSVKTCAPKGDKGTIGACTCSPAATEAALFTACTAKAKDGSGGCPGQRQCTKAGLSACQGPELGTEICDGIDNDCDGQTDDGACDDSNPCTVDLCAPASETGALGVCSHNPATGAPCNADNSLCTVNDTCNGSKCLPGKAIDCDDKNPCSLDICAASKGCQHGNDDGVLCSDDNPCTVGDLCQDGGCQPGKPKACTVDQPCTVATCDLATGKCGFAAAADGQPCDDNTLCTEKDGCVGGKCAGKTIDCDDKNPCTYDGCASTKGCTHTNASSGCDDANACTVNDQCADGQCVGTPKSAASCDDANPCTTDGCDVKLGCAHTKTDAGCDDGDVCTNGDKCTDGACKPGPNICECSKDADCAKLEDGNLCNGTMICKAITTGKLCTIDPASIVACDKAKDTACVKATCAPKTGLCSPLPVADTTTTCDADGSVCTLGDHCVEGNCLAGKLQDCDDKNGCTNDSCDPKIGCVHMPNGAPCNADDDNCTQSDACFNGQCLPGNLANCDDKKLCTVDSCNPKSGACVYATLPKDGSPCDADGTACTANDTCLGGKCEAGKALNCEDGNLCSNDSCDAVKGCVNAPNNLPCDADGSLCTVNDICANKSCVAGQKTVCDDKVLCTKDSCNPATGQCIFDINAGNGTPCDADGSVCTDKDACAAGKCAVGTPLNCDDQNPCTADTCDVLKGCLHASAKDNTSCGTAKVCKSGVCKPASACNYGFDLTYGGPAEDYSAHVLALGSSYIIAANTQSKLGGDSDGWLVKTNDAGKFVWSSPTGGPGNDLFADVIAVDGGYAVAGSTASKGAGGSDAWLVRFDANGSALWQFTAGGTGNETAKALTATTDAFYLAGYVGAPATGDALLARADKAGGSVWTKTLPKGAFSDVVVAGGGLVAAGSITGKGAGGADFWIAGFDFAGTALWEQVHGGAKDDTVSELVPLTDGYLLAGTTASKGAGGTDIWFVRTDTVGKKLWDRTYGTANSESLAHAVQTPDGFAALGALLTPGTGLQDVLFVRTDATGNLLVLHTFGGDADDWGAGMAATSNGWIFGAATTSKGAGGTDVWLLRTDEWGFSDCPSGGLCQELVPSQCNDGKPCTADWCDPAKGCSNTPILGCQ